MYVLKNSIHGGDLHAHLYEMTAKEFREAKATDTLGEHNDWEGDGFFHEHISADRAHRHVKAGRIHSTYLYTEDGRIRRARD